MSSIDIVLYAASGVLPCLTFMLLGWACHDIVSEQRRRARAEGYAEGYAAAQRNEQRAYLASRGVPTPPIGLVP